MQGGRESEIERGREMEREGGVQGKREGCRVGGRESGNKETMVARRELGDRGVSEKALFQVTFVEQYAPISLIYKW